MCSPEPWLKSFGKTHGLSNVRDWMVIASMSSDSTFSCSDGFASSSSLPSSLSSFYILILGGVCFLMKQADIHSHFILCRGVTDIGTDWFSG